MYVLNVLDIDEDGTHIKYTYGPFNDVTDARIWAKNFPDYGWDISKLIKPTYNADQILPIMWLSDHRRTVN